MRNPHQVIGDEPLENTGEGRQTFAFLRLQIEAKRQQPEGAIPVVVRFDNSNNLQRFAQSRTVAAFKEAGVAVYTLTDDNFDALLNVAGPEAAIILSDEEINATAFVEQLALTGFAAETISMLELRNNLPPVPMQLLGRAGRQDGVPMRELLLDEADHLMFDELHGLMPQQHGKMST